MRILCLEDSVLVGQIFLLDHSHTRHLRNVLRFKVGDYITARTGRERVSLTRLQIVESTPKGFIVKALDVQWVSSPLVKLELAQGYPKASKFDEVLRMAIEAGASRVIPLICDYGDVKHMEVKSKTERWKRIAREAVEQSGNLDYITVDDVYLLYDFFSIQEESTTINIVCDSSKTWKESSDLMNQSREKLFTNIHTIRIFVGPEGGFSLKELEYFENHNVLFYHFGSTILRTEHAGLYALATVKTLLHYKGV